MLKTIIIDDEQLARKRIENLLNDIDYIEIIEQCNSGTNAIKAIKTLKPDLIYLDIDMKDINGFEMLSRIDIDDRPHVIFVTAYDEFALKAFEYYAIDYLLKPFKDERFINATENAKRIINSKNNRQNFEESISKLIKTSSTKHTSTNTINNKKFAIKSNGKIILINKSDIKYITASGYYAEVFTSEKKYLIRESLSNLLDKLNSDLFIRIHRSTIINLDMVHELIYSNYSEIDVRMVDEKRFRVSKSNRSQLTEKIGV